METVLEELTAIRAELKALSKLVRKVRTFQEDPTGEKTKERSANNGFKRPQNISEKLRGFLGLPKGELISRSDVTKKINEYVKANSLNHPDNGRIIVLDDKLKALLNPPEGIQITFLNIQKYLSPHYVKNDDEPKPLKRPSVRKVKA